VTGVTSAVRETIELYAELTGRLRLPVAPPIVNAIILPLLFLSGIFIASDNPPGWVNLVGRIFPVRHLVDAMRASYLGIPFHWSDILVIAIWLVAAVIVASRTFRWEPAR